MTELEHNEGKSHVSVYVGWIASVLGMLLWGHGYLANGTPSLISWGDYLPSWASEWLLNLEFEIGMALVLVGSIPLYWDMWRGRA